MFRTVHWLGGLSLMAALTLFCTVTAQNTPQSPEQMRQQAQTLITQGNWQDAYKLLEQLLVDKRVPGSEAASDLESALHCLSNLGLHGQFDELLVKALAVRGEDWRFLSAAAMKLSGVIHHGVLANQKFSRNPREFNQGGKWINVAAQDRQQSLIWLEKALKLTGEIESDIAVAQDKGSATERGALWSSMGQLLLMGRHDQTGWQLQIKTPLDTPPTFEADDDGIHGVPQRRASVDEAGRPQFWPLPESWQAANSDGQRIRWTLKKLDTIDDAVNRDAFRFTWAHFLNSQFGVETLQQEMWTWRAQAMRNQATENPSKTEQENTKIADDLSAILQLSTLSDKETIAKLASGIERFELPDEFNPIRIWQQLLESKNSVQDNAREMLITAFGNRKQYVKAAQLTAEGLANAQAANQPPETIQYWQQRYDNFVKPRGQFEQVPAQPAGQGAKLEIVFRNTKSVAFTAKKVDLEKLITEFKAAVRAPNNGQNQPDPSVVQRYSWDYPAHIFQQENVARYASQTVAEWSQAVESPTDHADSRATITTPLDKGGLYIVDANLDDGAHRTRCMVWINDLAIVHKHLDGEQMVYVADAVTGKPLSGADIEFFGHGNAIQSIAKKTNAEGQVRFKTTKQFDNSNQWVVVARDAKKRLAVSQTMHFNDQSVNYEMRTEIKAFGVADQPVHRPGDTVRCQLWVGHPDFAKAQPASNRQLSVVVMDPQGKKAWEGSLKTDRWGAVAFEFELAKSATLGTYAVQLGERDRIDTNLRFRVEEFRKPEFEVTVDAPDKPVTLGEKFTANIKAKYFFGTPVADATVKVRVTRSSFVDDWYPVRPFDWCYGRGYWWFAYDYDWYPGWQQWHGCFPPMPPWRPWGGMEQPELVLDQELTLDAEGVAKLSIDTALAAKLHGKQDHKYAISVEVRDASRRTITAEGSVVASRQPFKIYSWLHRGYYRVGETVEANFQAQTLGRVPVVGSGKLDLLRVTYDAQRQPQETIVETWDAKTNAEGTFQQRLVVRRGGQYRLRLTLKDSDGHEVKGAYVFTVRGDNQAADNFRFSELELIPDKSEYAPGETVQLQINADRADATVLVFVRANNGVVPAPQLVQLVNKTARVTIDVQPTDQPNFHVEAFTIFNGKLYDASREIFVPPASKSLNVAIKADKEEYLPGEKAKLALEVRDASGKPVTGSVLISVYDRALEQIGGDVLPGDIREFFWKWRRQHYPTTYQNLSRVCEVINIQGQPAKNPLGIFDRFDQAHGGFLGRTQLGMNMRGMGMEGGFGGGGGDMSLSMAAPMAAKADMAGGMGGMAGGMGGGMAVGQAMAVAPTTVRKEFADSALWLTNVKCDKDGRATAEFAMPENLSDWQVRTWVVGPGMEVGSSAATAVTHKNILIRLATPRFLTERDQVVISAIVHNDFNEAHDVKVRLEIDGGTQFEFAKGTEAERIVNIKAHEQLRVDWPCIALAEGEIKLRAFAEAAAQSDAMEIKLPIIVNGTFKTDSWAGTVRPDQASTSIKMMLPKERRVEHSRLTVRVSPSLAAAMVDATPYLVDYPYGCTEQTLNRFLPTVMTQRMLKELNVDLAQVKQHRQNLNAQELGNPADRAKQRQPKPPANEPPREPVFDTAEVNEMVDVGVQRLTDMQCPDGGWGWFSGNLVQSSPHTTAVVVRGLLTAQANEVAIVPDVLNRGMVWLENYQNQELSRRDELAASKPAIIVEPNNVDALVFQTLVLGGKHNPTVQQWLYEKRGSLSVYGKTLLALATHQLDNAQQTAMLRQNIEQFLVDDAENETALLRDATPWWYWYGSTIEATAQYLKLLAAIEPKGRVAPRLVKYLLNNRKHGTYWNSTRDTALVIEAFADYIRASGELKGDVGGEVWLSGKRIGSVKFTPQTLFTAETTIELTGNAVPDGEQTLEIRRQGNGPLYYSVYATNFTLEEEIAPAGLEVKIERRYYRLDPVQKKLDLAGDRGELLEGKRAAYNRVPIEDLQAVPSGALVEVELQIDSKNDYEYMIIEERKAAGLEPVDVQSGYQWQGGLGLYRELREKHVAFFIESLPRGRYTLSYQLRTEAPGTFTALPAVISGMYAPELVGNSADKDLMVAP